MLKRCVTMATPTSTALAVFAFFVIADAVYTVDHYLIHHDRARYRRMHSRHHRRYNGPKDAPQLDGYEFVGYSSAALLSFLLASVLSLVSGNWGFALGAVLKYAHSLLFHLYQHRWWGDEPLRKQALGTPSRSWGLASARYHAFHHSHPDDALFTYAESWRGFDRILERLHPVLVRFTADGRAAREDRGPTAVKRPGGAGDAATDWFGWDARVMVGTLVGASLGAVGYAHLLRAGWEVPWVVGVFAGVGASLGARHEHALRGVIVGTFAAWLAAYTRIQVFPGERGGILRAVGQFHTSLSLGAAMAFIGCGLVAGLLANTALRRTAPVVDAPDRREADERPT